MVTCMRNISKIPPWLPVFGESFCQKKIYSFHYNHHGSLHECGMIGLLKYHHGYLCVCEFFLSENNYSFRYNHHGSLHERGMIGFLKYHHGYLCLQSFFVRKRSIRFIITTMVPFMSAGWSDFLNTTMVTSVYVSLFCQKKIYSFHYNHHGSLHECGMIGFLKYHHGYLCVCEAFLSEKDLFISL